MLASLYERVAEIELSFIFTLELEGVGTYHGLRYG